MKYTRGARSVCEKLKYDVIRPAAQIRLLPTTADYIYLLIYLLNDTDSHS